LFILACLEEKGGDLGVRREAARQEEDKGVAVNIACSYISNDITGEVPLLIRNVPIVPRNEISFRFVSQ
jgi:hypothetical protein